MTRSTPRRIDQSVRHRDTWTPSPQVTFRNMPPDEVAVRIAHQRQELFELDCAHGSTHASVIIEPTGSGRSWCATLRLSAGDAVRSARAEGRSPPEAVDRAFEELSPRPAAVA